MERSERNIYENDEETKYIGKNKACECCNERILSDDPEIAAEGLCDRCNREINEDAEIIGWRKGE